MDSLNRSFYSVTKRVFFRILYVLHGFGINTKTSFITLTTTTVAVLTTISDIVTSQLHVYFERIWREKSNTEFAVTGQDAGGNKLRTYRKFKENKEFYAIKRSNFQNFYQSDQKDSHLIIFTL